MSELKNLYSKNFEKQLKTLQTSFDKLNQDLLESAKGLKKVDESLKGVGQTQSNLNKKNQDAEKLRKQALIADREIIKNEREIIKNKQLEAKEQSRLNREKGKQSKLSAKNAREAEKEASAYYKLNKRLGESRQKAKDLGAATKVNNKEFRRAQREVRKLDTRFKKLDNSLGLNQRSVGKYSNALKGSIGSMVKFAAGMVGITMVFRAFGNAIKTMANFEKAMDKVQAVTGATSKEIRQLSKDAKRLGSITSKSSTDVAGLQLEFAKLGFSTAEILAATEATISLSIAAGSDLADSAVVAASTVRGFGLDATDTQRVVDVMAKSFASSALDIEKFKTGMGAVAPVAKASGKSIEFTTAQLSVLNDAGIDASTAGTSLRNMFLELNKQGLTWEEGLEKINTSTNKNVTALELFGKRGATAALVLANNVDKATELEKAYDGAAGSAKEMADIMEDNLISDVDKLSSAWEGFILGLNKGDGVISNSFRNLIKWITAAVTGLKRMNQSVHDINLDDTLESAKTNIEDFAKKVAKGSKETIAYNKKMIELEKEFLKTLDKRIPAYEKISAQIERRIKENEKLSKIDNDKEAKTDAYNKKIEETIVLIAVLSKKSLDEKNKRAKFDAILMAQAENELIFLQQRLEGLNKIPPVIKEETTEVENNTKAINKNTKAIKEKAIALDDIVNIKADPASNEKELSFLELVAQIEEENNQDILDQIAEEDRKKEDAHQKELQRIKNIKEATLIGLEAVGMIGNEIFMRKQMQYDEDLKSINRQYETDMALAGDNELAKREAIRKREDAENKIKVKQAKTDKQAALFNIALNTAVSVIKVAWNPFAVAGVIALGALEAALVASRPLPKFDKGTKSAPKGMIEVAENRPELVIQNGKMSLIDKPTITDKLAGAQIIGGAQTEMIMNAAKKGNIDDTTIQLMAGFDKIKEGINDININFGFNDGGQAYVERNNNGKTAYAEYYKF